MLSAKTFPVKLKITIKLNRKLLKLLFILIIYLPVKGIVNRDKSFQNYCRINILVMILEHKKRPHIGAFYNLREGKLI